jgi:uncharacterized protein (DUF1697 family)
MVVAMPRANASAGRRQRFVALLRGINVGGNKRVPMSELRILATKLGCADVTTYIQSGNLLFSAPAAAAAGIAAQLEGAIVQHFGFSVPVVVRSAMAFTKALRACPFVDAAAERENLLHAGFAVGDLPESAAAELAERAAAGERVAVAGGALWIDYGGGVARSKLTPVVVDRVVGSIVTMRNHKSMAALAAMLADDVDD